MINPLDRERVFIESGRDTIEFDTDNVLDPGGMDERLIASKGKKILSYYDGKSFVMEHINKRCNANSAVIQLVTVEELDGIKFVHTFHNSIVAGYGCFF